MRVLVACEFSGTVRDAFARRGHDAWSCDLLDSVTAGKHFKADIRTVLEGNLMEWPIDLLIAHPPCTDLAVSGARHFAAKKADGRQERALDFVRYLMDQPLKRICIENPVSIISSRIRKPDQIIQPWMFGHSEFKATCLWLKNLPPLVPTLIKDPPARGTPEHRAWSVVHRRPPTADRWKLRSVTYTGVAEAMAEQWGNLA